MPTTSILAQTLYVNREATGDVTFIVGSESVFAHRCVLAALSPKYHAQFYGGHPDHGDINVHDISAPAFKEFIKFLYLEKADFTLDNIGEILYIAKQCLVEHLVIKCGIFLIDVANGQNLLPVFRLAKLYSIKPVLDLCESKIRGNTLKVLNNEEFLDCDHETLLHILDIEPLDCKEILILNKCISWAEASCRRKNLDETNMTNIRNELGSAIYRMQFWLLTVGEFVSFYKSHEGLLTPNEFIEITCIIGNLPGFESENFAKKQRTELNLAYVPVIESSSDDDS